MFLASSRHFRQSTEYDNLENAIFPKPKSVKVAVTENYDYSPESLRKSINRLISHCDPPLSKFIKRGDRVLIKPYLHTEGGGSTRRHSHPSFILALVEAVRDCGGIVSIGDEGFKKYHALTTPSDNEWIYEMARVGNVSLVSFAKSGGQTIRSSLAYPRHYLIANALLEADVVINCANFQPNGRLVLSGAVRNMFNAALGKTQNHFYELFKSNERLAKVIVDICKTVRPTYNFLDVTMVREPGDQGIERPIGLIMASQDPVALDLVAAKAVGYDNEKIWTTIYGGQMGLGCSDFGKIEVKGIEFDWSTVHRIPLPIPCISTQTESTFETVSRIINKMLLRPRPVLTAGKCNGCGDCKTICPTNAISILEKYPRINLQKCLDCQLCISACNNEAIALSHVGIGYLMDRKKFFLKSLWNEAKIGIDVPLGPLSASIKLTRRSKIGQFKKKSILMNQNYRPNKIIESEIQASVATRTDHIHSTISGAEKVTEIAVIFGVGPGLGSALARRFAKGQMHVAMVARSTRKLEPLMEELGSLGVTAMAYSADVRFDRSIRNVMSQITLDIGVPTLVVYNVEHFIPGGILEIETPAFVECWQAMCLGAFVVGREAAKYMVQDRKGTIIFTGATASTRGRAGYINMAVGKWGIRALAQSMARELGPKGIHVAHVIVDGGIAAPSNGAARQRMSALFPEEIAESYYHLHKQHPSAWTHEIDLRPWVETF